MDRKGKIALIMTLFVVTLLVVSLVVAARGGKAPRAVKECRDGIDNDGDGNTDYPADSGCSSKNDIDETDCGDGVCEGGETVGSCPADCSPPDSCSDTDGGNYVWTFGTTSGYYNGNQYSNDDYCVDASNVNEYYCNGNYETSTQTSCGTDASYDYCIGNVIWRNSTDFSCSGGACDASYSNVEIEDCDESDGYGANYCSAGDVYRDYFDYSCNSATCEYTQTPNLVQDCIWGCTVGACDQPPADSCTSTDGSNPYVFGGQYGYFNASLYNVSDVCNDAFVLTEYYCSGDYLDSFTHNCTWNATGCSNGACYI
ncbi:hypothetical protein GOV07_04575 [Candidatus Woesearchaeota archaeon]|nr:hypothetical protein [Candidatus Woesearchaeota archaeon]